MLCTAIAVEEVERWLLVNAVYVTAPMVQGSDDRGPWLIPDGDLFILEAAEIVGLRLLLLQ